MIDYWRLFEPFLVLAVFLFLLWDPKLPDLKRIFAGRKPRKDKAARMRAAR